MDFYSALCAHYNEVFPLDPTVSDFVQASLELTPDANQSGSNILDIGCATGSLALSLATMGHRVMGIDLDAEMISMSNRAAANLPAGLMRFTPEFLVADMMNISKQFAHESFDRILCMGNTLVHLPDQIAIADFFAQSRALLAADGKLLVQILNYDRILDHGIMSLPAIETKNMVFTREYHMRTDNRLDFCTNLTGRETRKTVTNVVPLLPLTKAEVDELLLAAGYKTRNYFGSFTRTLFSQESFVLVIEASL
ncbi:MAG: class I SAM-dependent methyltransferase [Spirochaetaceae bacterium]|nr:MAG: class I SAM-dependent methyltransferase [Spirochaetaceae bacterium]